VTPPSGPAAGPWAPFRPVRGRRVALGFAIAQAVVLVALAVVVPGGGWIDVVGFVAVAAAVGWVLLRFALIRAEPSPEGLVVRNVIRRDEVRWEQVVAVRFGDGDPWVTLDLSDGDVLAVMAIQRADGAHGLAEARRLATLVAAGSRTPRDD
jgi:Bacterial PH domain